MEKVAFTAKLEKEQVELLKEISEKTHIPQSVLVRDWIDKGIKERLGLERKGNINDDPIVKLKGLFEAEKDLSVNHDKYLYGKRGKV